MKTAAKPKPSKVSATSANPPAPAKPQRPPPGSKPDEAAVERIRELRGETGQLEAEAERAAAAVAEPETFLRNQIHSRLPMETNPYEVPAEKLWQMFLQAWKPQGKPSIPHCGDFEEAYARYKAAVNDRDAKIKARDKKHADLNALVDAELPKLQVAIDERTENVLKEVIDTILPFCQDADEANRLAEQFSRVIELRDARGRCFFASDPSRPVARASYFRTAWETLHAGAAANSQG